MTERLKELVVNEKDYLDLLQKASKVYKEFGLQSLEDKSLFQMPLELQDGKFEKLFVNIEELSAFHEKTVLPFFEKSVKIPSILFSLFSNYKKVFFRLYGPYCSNQNKFMGIFKANVDYFEQVGHLTNCSVSLNRIFLAPLHSISKYKLLIADAEKEFRQNGDFDEADMLVKVLQEVDDICSYCDEIVEIAYIINYEVGNDAHFTLPYL